MGWNSGQICMASGWESLSASSSKERAEAMTLLSSLKVLSLNSKLLAKPPVDTDLS